MKLRWLIVCALAVLVGALAGWWLSSADSGVISQKPVSNSAKAKATYAAGVASTVAVAAKQESQAASSKTPTVLGKPKNPTELLAEFDLTGDRTLLVQAQKWFPHDKRVIMATCLTATDPKSTWLAELEKTQPDNVLPNVVRAALLAKRGDLAGFAKELQLAGTKTKLDTHLRERQAEVLDRILIGKGVLPRSLFGTTDGTFFKNLEIIQKTFTANPKLLGDPVEAASTSVALASIFRGMSDLGVSYSHYGNQLELGILKQVPRDTGYGEGNLTVGQRVLELNTLVTQGGQALARYQELITAANADPVLRLQYYTRVRSDGENEALQWLFSLPRK